ncbi:MAG: hypothetical protein KGJ23_05880 [Euryarchaeota archaeon]|nr:hypothetical protein [Euryarchaeota archaeon]MDE1836128.1 hypothetical protein [Euryarchaeota archaeon]MDE1879418.1 hypothetical protein [Euryarchaeota archaeon]MDE2044106.1 hypothetical protein [Thermoplasmata archaeon]
MPSGGSPLAPPAFAALLGAIAVAGMLLGSVPFLPTSGALLSGPPPHHALPSPTYVILVHGYDPSTTPATVVWTYGVNLYQQLVNAGYIVGVVTYYGTFTLAFSNGTTYSDPSYYGTTAVPIETISMELAKMLTRAFAHTAATVDILGHSMGGLVTEYMLEHTRLTGVTLKNVIWLGSPLDGAPVTYLTPWLNLSGYQAAEMSQGSAFLTELHAWVPNARANYPSTEWLTYVGYANPYWAMAYFSGHANDGLVDAPSAESVAYDHAYLFPDLHIPQLDSYTPGKVSYFEDQNFASEVLANFSGHY